MSSPLGSRLESDRQHPTSGARVLANFSSLAVARVVGAALEFVAQIVVARAWGPAAFGTVVFGRVAANYFGIVADPGLSMIGMRRVAQRPVEGGREWWQFMKARAITSGGAALLMAAFALLLAPTTARATVLGYVLLVVPFGLSFEWLFKGLERMWLVALVRVLRAAAFLALTLVIVQRSTVPALYAIGEGLSWCLSSAVFYLGAKQYLTAGTRREPVPSVESLVRTAMPIGFAWLLATAYQLGAVVLLTFLSGAEQAGLYGAAQRPVIFLQGFGVLLGESLVAIFVRAGGPRVRGELTLRICLTTLAILLPLTIAVSFGSQQVAELVFGRRFLAAGPVLGLLVWQGLLLLLNIPFYVTLIASRHESVYLRAIAAGAMATLLLDLLAVPHFGALGAAVVGVLVEASVLTLIVVPTLTQLEMNRAGTRVAVMLAVGGVACAIGLVIPVPVFWRVGLVGLIGWLGCGIAIRGLFPRAYSTMLASEGMRIEVSEQI